MGQNELLFFVIIPLIVMVITAVAQWHVKSMLAVSGAVVTVLLLATLFLGQEYLFWAIFYYFVSMITAALTNWVRYLFRKRGKSGGDIKKSNP